ncbi:MAG: glutamate synthase central domain-containing protein, partial [Cyanobacteriota bacterium]|nr:glutamate synthase central domain-containing protein [Cyanobacteriota bacterium]
MNFARTDRVSPEPFGGQPWLVEERDACGVGFIAHQDNEPSHDIVVKALCSLSCLEHRGGCSADYDSGDGSGVMSAIPWEIIHKWLGEESIAIPAPEKTGVGMVFLAPEENAATQVREITERVLEREGLTVLGWRPVPVRPEVLGPQARAVQPRIEQLVVTSETLVGDALDRQLYLARRAIGKELETTTSMSWGDHLYICSFSCRTIVYKAMVRASILGEFYQDLTDPEYVSAFALYHRRFSTNTMPKWPLAQPMRLLGHNGEINTLLGNINWMKARQAEFSHPNWGDRIEQLKPCVDANISDSANLDNSFELLVRTGRSTLESLMLLVPEAYQHQPELQDDPEVVDFYEYYSGIQEPWDGPALLAFSDGKTVGAGLDRNGLRPARYVLTRDRLVIVASEAGVVDLEPGNILEKGRLGPGQMLAVDLENHQVLKNWDIKRKIARSHPYGEWVAARPTLGAAPTNGSVPPSDAPDPQTLVQQQTAFGYTKEDVEMIIVPMAQQAKEPTYCMGDDIPLAVLSDKPRLLYDYFKQRFAQVTNPAIDPLREGLVMSLSMALGTRGNLLDDAPGPDRLLKVETPVLTESELVSIGKSGLKVTTLSTLFDIAAGPDGLKAAVENLCQEAMSAVEEGAEILVLSDRDGTRDDRAYIPPMLAVGAVHHDLIERGLRMRASLVVDTAQCWSTHHYACLLGYGASAVCPYLTWTTLRGWWHDPKTQKMMESGKIEKMSLAEAMANYRKATNGGLLKILSKMGISRLSSYQGAQIFEAIGIGGDLLELGMTGTASRIGGLSVAELAREVFTFHQRAFPNAAKLEHFGFIQYRKGGEYHGNNPELTKVLHKAVREGTYDHYQAYQDYLGNRPVAALRDLLDFQSDRESIEIDEVESTEEIVKRFCTGGMSLGALSPEAHETLAIAMNRLGGKSNSGEGGEDP